MADSNDIKQPVEQNTEPHQKAALKLDRILNKVREKAQAEGLDLTKNLSIIIGKETAYKGVIGQRGGASVFRMVPDKIDVLERALSDPQTVKESVRMLHNGDKVFHVVDGSTVKDTLGLSETQNQAITQEPNSRQVELEKSATHLSEDSPIAHLKRQLEDLKQEAHQSAVVEGKLIFQEWDIKDLQKATQTQSNEIDTLKKVVEDQQITIDQLKQGLEHLSRSVSPSVKSTALSKWIDSTTDSVKSTAQSMKDKLSLAVTGVVDKTRSQVIEMRANVTQKADAVRSQVNDKVNQVKAQVAEKVNTVTATVNDKASEIKTQISQQVDILRSSVDGKISEAKERAVSTAVNKMLDWVGEKQHDGSRTFKTDSLQIMSKDGAVSIKTTDNRQIVADGKITATATPQDIDKLNQIEQKVEQISQSQVQTQSQSKSQLQSQSKSQSLHR